MSLLCMICNKHFWKCSEEHKFEVSLTFFKFEKFTRFLQCLFVIWTHAGMPWRSDEMPLLMLLVPGVSCSHLCWHCTVRPPPTQSLASVQDVLCDVSPPAQELRRGRVRGQLGSQRHRPTEVHLVLQTGHQEQASAYARLDGVWR